MHLLVDRREGPAHDDVVIAGVDLCVQLRAPDQIHNPLLRGFDLHTLSARNNSRPRKSAQ